MRHYFPDCNVPWPAISRDFPQFEAYVTPLALLGLSPVSEAQMFGVVLAFHTYHAMRKGCNMYGHPIDNVARPMRYFIPRSSRMVKAFYAATKRPDYCPPSMATLSASHEGLNNKFCNSYRCQVSSIIASECATQPLAYRMIVLSILITALVLVPVIHEIMKNRGNLVISIFVHLTYSRQRRGSWQIFPFLPLGMVAER